MAVFDVLDSVSLLFDVKSTSFQCTFNFVSGSSLSPRSAASRGHPSIAAGIYCEAEVALFNRFDA